MEIIKKTGYRLLLIVIAFGLLYIAGWEISKGKPIYGDGYLNTYNILVAFNGSGYGLELTQRFFHSPIISWVLLGFSFIMLFASISVLI